jgi:hypothetical protein
MNPEKIKKLQAQEAVVRIGGKGRKTSINILNNCRKMIKNEIDIRPIR